MTLSLFFFYLFAAIALASAFMVVAARNPVHAVLFLILTFFNTAGLFVLAGAEFLAMILVVVYVGAVAVLFLFVVMMLDIDFAHLKKGILQYMPVGAIIGGILLLELVLVLGGWSLDGALVGQGAAPTPDMNQISNTRALGQLIFTRYVYVFITAGCVLLVAMIGAIVLTLRHKDNVKRQDIGAQVARTPQSAIEVVQVKSGKGLSS